MYDLLMLIAAMVVLIAVILAPRLEENKYITTPVFFLFFGVILFHLPAPWHLPELTGEPWAFKRITEFGVIVALASAGLKINRPFEWVTWKISWRLLAFTMPLTIFFTALLGWWAVGLVPASALLLGAVSAPTDPVLADDVQTSSPSESDSSFTRLTLTSEAGLNDGLAFPFTNLAIAVAIVGLDPAGWFGDWILIDVFYKITAGALTGAFSGWLLAYLLFNVVRESSPKIIDGVFAIALVFFPYAFAELMSGYGFIAVFISACVFRQQESEHNYQEEIHSFSVTMEQILEAVLMLMIGGYIVYGVFEPLTLSMVLVAIVFIFIVRPVSCFLAFPGSDLSQPKRWVIAFFGIRGIGSLYYLSYGIYHADFPQQEELWAIMILIVVISVVLHGTLAAPVMNTLDRWKKKQGHCHKSNSRVQ